MQLANTLVVGFEGSWRTMDTRKLPSGSASRAEQVVRLAQGLLESQPQFAGRSRLFKFEYNGDTLVIYGAVPTFYLKQILQSTLKALDGVRLIDNRVSVDPSDGLAFARDRSYLT